MVEITKSKMEQILQNAMELDTYNRYDLAEQSGLVEHFEVSNKWFDFIDDYIRYSGQVMGVYAEKGVVIFICDGEDVVLYDRKTHYSLLKEPNKVTLPTTGQRVSINDVIAGLQLSCLQIFDINNCDPKEVQLGINRENNVREWIIEKTKHPGYLVLIYCEKMMEKNDD